jgi:hypothetical protein
MKRSLISVQEVGTATRRIHFALCQHHRYLKR